MCIRDRPKAAPRVLFESRVPKGQRGWAARIVGWKAELDEHGLERINLEREFLRGQDNGIAIMNPGLYHFSDGRKHFVIVGSRPGHHVIVDDFRVVVSLAKAISKGANPDDLVDYVLRNGAGSQ